MNILLTGSTGFIGRRTSVLLTSRGHQVTNVVRSHSGDSSNAMVIDSLDGDTDWTAALRDKDIVIHTAALAHRRAKVSSSDELSDDVYQVNVTATANLARQAGEADVRRFIFISSIGVNGFVNDKPFTESDLENPCDPYARSKFEAEKQLWEISRQSNMEVVIIRPPLVYGRNAPGNFGTLVRLVEKRIPLPLGAVNNTRSLVALDNLVDLIITCINHPEARNEVFFAGDGEDLSTTELLRAVGQAKGKLAILIPVPTGILMFVARLFGKKVAAQRVLGSLQVDISKARSRLGWEPPLTVQEGIRRCFLSENNF